MYWSRFRKNAEPFGRTRLAMSSARASGEYEYTAKKGEDGGLHRGAESVVGDADALERNGGRAALPVSWIEARASSSPRWWLLRTRRASPALSPGLEQLPVDHTWGLIGRHAVMGRLVPHDLVDRRLDSARF
jgi:hypothetical protein